MTYVLDKTGTPPDIRRHREVVVIGNQMFGLLGVQGADGARGIAVDYRGKETYIPLQAFANNEFERLLAKHDIIVSTSAIRQEIRHKVGEITDFLKKEFIITRPGWAGPRYSLGDGTIYQSAKVKDSVVLFDTRTSGLGSNGESADWLAQVALPLTGQHIPMFFVMCAFVGPLLKLFEPCGNAGFELCGPTCTGKSLALELMASAIGPAHIKPGGNLLTTALEAGSRDLIVQRSDLAIIIDDRDFAEDSEKPAGAAAFNHLITTLYGASALLGPDGSKVRLVHVIASRERLAGHLKGSGANTSQIARDRLITIPVGPERPYGIFECVPAGFAGPADFAETLRHAIERCHGHAIRQFLSRLVQEQHDDKASLLKRLNEWRARFLQCINADPLNGAAQAVAQAFANEYAAALLAQRYGVLPKSWHCLAAVKAVYKLHLAADEPRSFMDRLHALARRPDVYNIDERGLARMSDHEVHQHAAFVRTSSGQQELLLTKAQRLRAFHDWLKIKDCSEVQASLLVQGDREYQTQCKIRSNKKKDRVYCFVLDPDIAT